MARTAEARPPAAPVSADQVARRSRILQAAADLGARRGLEGVQMHEVARDAGVAIGTLYRYFPSKTQLFAAVFEWRISQFMAGYPLGGDSGETAAAAEVAEMLVALTRDLLGRPRLAAAMVQSSVIGYASVTPAQSALVEGAVVRAVLRALRLDEPGETDMSRARLVLYSWWGVLVSLLSDKTSAARAEADLRLAVRLLLAPCNP